MPVEKGHIPPGYVAQTYLGLWPEVPTRMSAAQRAQQAEVCLTVGGEFWSPATPTAQRIAAQVALEDVRERKLVEEAYAVEATPAPLDPDT